MNKRVLSAVLAAVIGSSYAFTAPASAASGYTMEYLDRGLIAVKTSGGIYLSWRLLGDESAGTQFDIYRDGELFATTDNTNYTDEEGFLFYSYQVVPHGEDIIGVKKAEVWNDSYLDIPLKCPANGVIAETGEVYTYSANDAAPADVDGDGRYELILKWEPSNSKDNSARGYTGIVYVDCYTMDGELLWRIDMGKNIRAGAHYTQMAAYDFDGDGKAELAMKTAPGTVDGAGNFVTTAGNTSAIINADNFADYRTHKSGKSLGHINSGPEYLTMFDGETGAAMSTIDYKPEFGSAKSWGNDSYGNRAHRYLSAVAYLDGKTPSLIVSRGYYERAAMVAYNWDGESFTEVWSRDDKASGSGSIYGQGAHSISVADVDNDGCDEIIFGSAVVDNDSSVLSNTRLGHGDALHVSDFNNDGEQEVFMVHEDSSAYKTAGAEVHKGSDATFLAKVAASSDTGRGVAANIDANIDKTTSGALFWSSANSNLYDLSGTTAGEAPSEMNFLIWWDGDLSRELLDRNRIVKYDSSVGSYRIETFSGVHYNNSSKATPTLTADLFGDWREEVVYPLDDDSALRIFTTTIPTDYKIPTLMHDPQYRSATAWQNVGYNQPPHTSYYIGVESESGNTIAPVSDFKAITTLPAPEITPDEEAAEYTEELITSSNSFNDGKWDFSGTVASVSAANAPFNNVLTVKSSSKSTKTFSTMPEAEQKGIGIDSFAVSADGLTAYAKVTNATDTVASPMLAFAAYDSDGTLVNVLTKSADIDAGSNAELSLTLSAAASVKAMLWESFSNQKPLCAALSAGGEYSAPINPENTKLVLKASFMWQPTGGNVTFFCDETTKALIGLYKGSASADYAIAARYYPDSSSSKYTTKTVIDGSDDSGKWYLADIIFDFEEQLMDVSVLDYSTPGAERQYIYGIPMPKGIFASSLSNIAVVGKGNIDNITIKRLTYKNERSVASFTVTDESGAAVSDATVELGGCKLITDTDGTARVSMANGTYECTVSKDAYKTTSATVELNDDTETALTLVEGEERSVYIHYINTNGTQISEDVPVGTAVENTDFAVPESAKADIAYTFTEDDVAGEGDISYEEHNAGDTVVFEYDADNSTSGNIRIPEGADAILTYVYKEKRVPVAGLDTEIISMNMSSDGYGHSYRTLADEEAAQYVSDSVKYLSVPAIESNNLTVNIPGNHKKLVMEFDVMLESMDYGGNIFGFTPYSGTTAGQSVGIRSSSQSTDQWLWVYGTGENYITYTDGISGDKTYRYSSNWRGKWAHCILVSDGSGSMNLTVVNKSNNIVYVQDYPLAVFGSEMPVTKLVFGRIAGDGTATMGFAGFKAYTVGAESGAEVFETTKAVTIPGEAVFTLDTATHISEIEGVDYGISGLIGVTYELWDESGNVCTPDGFELSDGGILTVTAETAPAEQYKVAVLVNGAASTVYNLNYRVRSAVFESSFTDSTDGFAAGKGSNTTISASGGTLYFEMNAANGGREFFKQLDGMTDGVVDVEYTFKTGGVKGLVTEDTWSWSGIEYEFAIQLLDADYDAATNAANINSGLTDVSDDHLLFEVSQAYTTSAQDTKYRINGGSSGNISSDWQVLSGGDGSILKRSVTTWVIKATLDLDNSTMDFKLMNVDDNSQGYEIKGISIANTNGFGTLRFLARKKGSSVTWKPTLSDVKVYHTK